MDNVTEVPLAARLRCRACAQQATRYLPGRKRTGFCDTHGPTTAEDWLRLQKLGGAPAPDSPVHVSVSAPENFVARPPRLDRQPGPDVFRDEPAESAADREALQAVKDVIDRTPRPAVSPLKALNDLIEQAHRDGYAQAVSERKHPVPEHGKGDFAELEAERDALSHELTTARNTLEEALTQRDTAQRAAAAERREKEAATTEARRSQNIARELSADNLQLDEKVKTYQRRVEQLERQVADLGRQFQAKDEELQDLARKTAELARSNTLLQLENEEQKRMLEELTAPPVQPSAAIAENAIALVESLKDRIEEGDRNVRPPRARAEKPATTQRVPLLADLLRKLPRGKNGLTLGATSSSEHAYKKLDDSDREKVETVLRFLAAEGFKNVKAAPLLLLGRNGNDKYTAVRYSLRGRIVLRKEKTYYEISDLTDRADKKWYAKEGR